MSDAVKSDDAPMYKWAGTDGEFRRQVSSFRDSISSAPGAKFPPESNRYHLYISLACPWACRVLTVRSLKGLQSVISLSIVDYHMGKDGWHFSEPEETTGCIPDTVNGAKLLREIYFKANPNYSGRFTVPVLWDTKTAKIVNNESSELIRMLYSEFDEWSSKPGVTYYPAHLTKEIDEANEWIYDAINNGVYKTGFATSQEAYEKHHSVLFSALDRVEGILSKNAFVVGETLTEADIRLFVTLVRFDPVYHTHFKCSQGTITHSYPHTLRWLRQVYQMPDVKETVNMTHIKGHYYKSHLQLNPTQIVPVWNGPDLDAPFDAK